VTDPTASGGPDRALILRLTGGDRSTALCLLAICQRADAEGVAPFHEVAIAYRDDHLNAMRAEGRDVEAEAGRLSVDAALGCYNEITRSRRVSQHPLNARLFLEDMLLRYARSFQAAAAAMRR